jgi:hypothetical protein
MSTSQVWIVLFIGYVFLQSNLVTADLFEVFNGYNLNDYPDCVGSITSQVYMSVPPEGCEPCNTSGCLEVCARGSETGCVNTPTPIALPNAIQAFFYTDDQCHNPAHFKPFGGYPPTAIFALPDACVQYLDASIYQEGDKIVVKAWSGGLCNGSVAEEVTFPVGECVAFPPSLNLGSNIWAIGYLPTSHSKPLSLGAIVGIAVGVGVGVVVGVIFLIWVYRRRGKDVYEAIN